MMPHSRHTPTDQYEIQPGQDIEVIGGYVEKIKLVRRAILELGFAAGEVDLDPVVVC